MFRWITQHKHYETRASVGLDLGFALFLCLLVPYSLLVSYSMSALFQNTNENYEIDGVVRTDPRHGGLVKTFEVIFSSSLV